ncbi:hypothetical protein, partial [Pseudovibrio axinellae]|uniref:hypothetical protein n=1 Tax=Pseudovibrio axinellae TaxID=989403 RepID=UPI00193CDD88
SGQLHQRFHRMETRYLNSGLKYVYRSLLRSSSGEGDNTFARYEEQWKNTRFTYDALARKLT